ncbi:MAG: GntR family transcriptional regulator [Pseudomonadota bacterium]
MNAPNQADLPQGGVAYAKLYAAIREGVFQPGDRLREVDVADRLTLSRTPIREALRRLEAEGIVEHRPRIGAIVRSLSHAEVVELYEMRAVLERTAAEMAAQHAAAAEVDVLDDLNAAIAAETEHPHRAAAINQDFHRAIYHATRNRFLLEAARTLNNALMLLGPTTLEDRGRITTVVGQHAEIITAIRNRDATAAGAAAEAHLQASLRHRLRTLGA